MSRETLFETDIDLDRTNERLEPNLANPVNDAWENWNYYYSNQQPRAPHLKECPILQHPHILLVGLRIEFLLRLFNVK